MTQSVLARVAALKSTPTAGLKALWRDLFANEPPPYNRRFLESRLGYRIQELAFGGLKPETVERIAALGEQLDGKSTKRARSAQDRPIAGTRLIREWQGVEHCVTVRDDGYEYQGRLYKSLSAIARVITPTEWMHQLANSLPLTDVSIPGTHQSAAGGSLLSVRDNSSCPSRWYARVSNSSSCGAASLGRSVRARSSCRIASPSPGGAARNCTGRPRSGGRSGECEGIDWRLSASAEASAQAADI